MDVYRSRDKAHIKSRYPFSRGFSLDDPRVSRVYRRIMDFPDIESGQYGRPLHSVFKVASRVRN